jgi:hypothetical protein
LWLRLIRLRLWLRLWLLAIAVLRRRVTGWDDAGAQDNREEPWFRSHQLHTHLSQGEETAVPTPAFNSITPAATRDQSVTLASAASIR